MAIRLDYSAWRVQDGEMSRRIDYQDSETKRSIATLVIDCRVEQGIVDIHTFLAFKFSPFRVVDGLDLGLSLAPHDGGRPIPVGVLVSSVDGGDGALMCPRTPQGLRLILSHLLAGYELRFGIFQGPEQLVDMPLYNDSEFAQLHGQLVTSITPPKKRGWFKRGWFGQR